MTLPDVALLNISLLTVILLKVTLLHLRVISSLRIRMGLWSRIWEHLRPSIRGRVSIIVLFLSDHNEYDHNGHNYKHYGYYDEIEP